MSIIKNTVENRSLSKRKTYKCINCGQIVESDSTPKMCPMCGAIMKKKQIIERY